MRKNKIVLNIVSLIMMVLILSGCGGGGVLPDTTPDSGQGSEDVLYIKDTNPDSGLLYLAGKEDGEKVMSLGSKDSQGNILEMNGAVFINKLGEGMAIEIDENCYPTRMVDSEGNKLTFENYTDSTVDITIYDFDGNFIEGPFTVDVDPDLLAQLNQLCSATRGIRELSRDAHDVAKFLKAASVGLKLAGCAASILGAAPSVGASLVFAGIACTSAVVSLVEALNPDIIPLNEVSSTAAGFTTNAVYWIFNDKLSPWGVGGWLTGTASDMVEYAATKEDINEIHSQFIQALEDQDWEEAWRCCILDSEAYNMVLDAEIAFANEGLDPDNTTVDISFIDAGLLFVERPIAYVHHDAVITITVEGYGTEVFEGEGLYTEFEELYENKWRLTKSGILNLLELGSQSDDSEEAIDGEIYNIIAPDNFALNTYYTAKVYVENIGDVAHTFTVRGLDNYGSSAIDFKEEEKSISLEAGQTGYVSFEYQCTGDTEDRGLIFRLYENVNDEPLEYIDQMTKIIQYSSGTTLPAPIGVDATDGTYTNRVYIDWDSVDDASYFKVYRATSETGTKTALTDWQTTYYSDYEVNPGTHYFYFVKAATSSNGANASDYSEPDEGWAYEGDGPPNLPAPANVLASQGTMDMVQIAWSIVTGATHYRVYRATSETGTKTAIEGWGWITDNYTFDFLGITQGVHYFYFVKAATDSIGSNASDYSEYAEGWTTGSYDAIPTIYDPGSSVNSGTPYTVSWSDESADGAEKYNLFEIESTATSGTLYTVYGTSKEFTHNVDKDTTYYYKVRAYSDGAWSSYSDQVDMVVKEVSCVFWTASQSGDGAGQKIDNWDISDVVTGSKINFYFDAMGIPDRWYIVYNGVVVCWTGWRGDASYVGDPLYPEGVISPGDGQVLAVITKLAGVDTLTVSTDSRDPDTAWDYRLETACK